MLEYAVKFLYANPTVARLSTYPMLLQESDFNQYNGFSPGTLAVCGCLGIISTVMFTDIRDLSR